MSLCNPTRVGALLRALGLLAGSVLIFGGAHAGTPLTLDEAWRLAEAANPALRTAQAGLAAAQGQERDAQSLLFNNPQLSAEHTWRRASHSGASDDSFPEWNYGVSQTFEIAGQRGYRREAAAQELAATDVGIEAVRRQIRAEVEQRFVGVLTLQRRIDTEREALQLVEESAAAVRKRVAAGEDTRLDGNLATVEAERARNQLIVLTENLIQARAELAAQLQLPPETLPEVVGQFDVALPPYGLPELLAAAAERPQLRALAYREQAARSRLGLERASVYPDLTIGLSSGREGPSDGRERLTTLSVSVPLPLFRRNAAGIGRASSELTQAEIERQAAARDGAAQVGALWLRLQSLQTRVKRQTEVVLPALEENKRLSATAFRAGEIGLVQLLLVNRQVLEARRDYFDAVSEFTLNRIALEQAAGWTGTR